MEQSVRCEIHEWCTVGKKIGTKSKSSINKNFLSGISEKLPTTTTMKGEQKTDSQMTTIIPVTMDHNHDNNERRTEMQQLRVSVKRKADDDLTSSPCKIGTKSKSSINKNFLSGISEKLQIRRTRKNNQA
jgi:hypothetical protein